MSSDLRPYPGQTGYFYFGVGASKMNPYTPKYCYGQVYSCRGVGPYYMRWSDNDPGGSNIPCQGTYIDTKELFSVQVMG